MNHQTSFYLFIQNGDDLNFYKTGEFTDLHYRGGEEGFIDLTPLPPYPFLSFLFGFGGGEGWGKRGKD